MKSRELALPNFAMLYLAYLRGNDTVVFYGHR